MERSYVTSSEYLCGVFELVTNLIEHGQIAVWRLLPKKKIVAILKKINNPSESLKEIKRRFGSKISFDEIACVRAHLKMKSKMQMRISFYTRFILEMHGAAKNRFGNSYIFSH